MVLDSFQAGFIKLKTSNCISFPQLFNKFIKTRASIYNTYVFEFFSGWIMLQGRQEDVDPNAIIEHCVSRLQETMKQT